METFFFTTRSLIFLAVFFLSGCGTIAPYVYSTTEQNVVHGTETVAITNQVLVCYNAEMTQPQNVIALAEKECALTNRQAKFVKHDFLACPVFLPARAYFSCVGQPVIADSVTVKKSQWPQNKQQSNPLAPIQVPVAEPEVPPTLPQHLKQ
ncbi:MAG: hypothetical protein OQJ97_16010 [Rhodospirillales bacterium]|nr:hypothetical protein [Rhodospirillales bacterium]